MLDASLTMTWAFTNEATPFTARVLEILKTAHAITPALSSRPSNIPISFEDLPIERSRRKTSCPRPDALSGSAHLLPIYPAGVGDESGY